MSCASKLYLTWPNLSGNGKLATTAPTFFVRVFGSFPITSGITLLSNGCFELNDGSLTNDSSPVPQFKDIIFG